MGQHFFLAKIRSTGSLPVHSTVVASASGAAGVEDQRARCVLPLMQYLVCFGKKDCSGFRPPARSFSASAGGRIEGLRGRGDGGEEGGGSTVKKAEFQGIISLRARRTVETKLNALEKEDETPRNHPPRTRYLLARS